MPQRWSRRGRTPTRDGGPTRTVGDLGEFGLIERIAARLPRPSGSEIWSGDDAAVLDPTAGHIVATVDAVVEGVDFDLAYAHPSDVGWKALAINLSDVASMGAEPWRALAYLGLPASTPVDVVEGFVAGLVELAERSSVGLVGGDISSASEITLSVTVLGKVETAVTRGGAQVGDAVCVTGSVGSAAAGLALARRGDERSPLVLKQLRPQPRTREGPLLGRAGATAMIDVSDGLLQDLHHLLRASGVGAELDASLIPVDAEALDVLGNIEGALSGGEDFELLCTLPQDAVEAARVMLDEHCGTPLTRIGSVVHGGVLTVDGQEVGERQGWEHLRDR